jgi:hypothetical protein
MALMLTTRNMGRQRDGRRSALAFSYAFAPHFVNLLDSLTLLFWEGAAAVLLPHRPPQVGGQARGGRLRAEGRRQQQTAAAGPWAQQRGCLLPLRAVQVRHGQRGAAAAAGLSQSDAL